jgi:hypothetical protein
MDVVVGQGRVPRVVARRRQLGIISAAHYTTNQAWARAIHSVSPRCDEIRYVARRMNKGVAYGIFERSGPRKLLAEKLEGVAGANLCDRFNVTVVRRRRGLDLKGRQPGGQPPFVVQSRAGRLHSAMSRHCAERRRLVIEMGRGAVAHSRPVRLAWTLHDEGGDGRHFRVMGAKGAASETG